MQAVNEGYSNLQMIFACTLGPLPLLVKTLRFLDPALLYILSLINFLVILSKHYLFCINIL